MSPSRLTKVSQRAARVLGIKLHEREGFYSSGKITRGESTYSVDTADTYVEEEPTTLEWMRGGIPTRPDLLHYAYSLFPFTHWITRYNAQWLAGDLIAGITVGAVVVPQGMAYAKLAALPVEFGLYSSFMGVLIYWFFATSKDITIGPVAVMSTLVGKIVLGAEETHPEVPGHVVASALAIVAGAIICVIGLARCGWIVDFISLTAISAFMTGSAINIAVGQVPNLLGIKGFDTRASTYRVIIDTLKYLGRTKIDAALGLTALFLLYAYRYLCGYFARRMPSRQKTFFFISTLRTALVILLYTLISWLVNRDHRKHPKFSILLQVPRGFQNAAVPTINADIIRIFVSELPATVIVLLIEHIAISKSFGRINNYTIDPSQELVAIGVTNLLGPFLGAYPATGSFSRTAIKSKAGVRTPFAGVITAIVVLLAIYALPAVFFYIPNSALSAVIIHAVGDLITPPNTIYQFWRVSPLEVIIFFAGVFVTVFSSIENGIYVTISSSVAVLLFRVVKAKGRFLGKVKIHSVIGDHLPERARPSTDGPNYGTIQRPEPTNLDPDTGMRNIFLPINHHDGSNPNIDIVSPYPGIFIYRFSEGYNFPNANHYLDYMVDTIFRETRRTNPDSYPRLGDRPWNNPGPRRGHHEADRSHLPTLKAIILDFSSVNNVDITSIQNLIDVRNQLDRYAAPDAVQWHVAYINNRWTKRALASAGFGYPTLPAEEFHRWKPIFSVAEIGGSSSAAAAAENRENRNVLRRQNTTDTEKGVRSSTHENQTDQIQSSETNSNEDLDLQKQLSKSKAYAVADTKRLAVVHGLNRPLFHIDLTSALQSAIANVERSQAQAVKKDVGTA